MDFFQRNFLSFSPFHWRLGALGWRRNRRLKRTNQWTLAFTHYLTCWLVLSCSADIDVNLVKTVEWFLFFFSKGKRKVTLVPWKVIQVNGTDFLIGSWKKLCQSKLTVDGGREVWNKSWIFQHVWFVIREKDKSLCVSFHLIPDGMYASGSISKVDCCWI